MRKIKILDISLQHWDDVYKAKEFNEKNNYDYILRDTNNLIEFDKLAYLLRFGYELGIYGDVVQLVHKNYNKEIEKDFGEESE